MRFKEILREDVIPQDEMFQLIARDCQPFLKQIDYLVDHYSMWRGMTQESRSNHGKTEYFGKKTARLETREPTDTSRSNHAEINDWLEQEYGHPFRNGVFCTGKVATANTYGLPMAIFPIGGFEFIWHKNIRDLYTNTMSQLSSDKEWKRYYQKETNKPISSDDDFNQFFKWKEEKEPVDLIADYFEPFILNKDLKGAITSGNEIMVWCKEYYYLGSQFTLDFSAWLEKQ